MRLRAEAASILFLVGLCGAAEPTGRPDTGVEQTAVVEPVYPVELKAQRVVGSVKLLGVVDENGNVRDLRVVSASQDEFARAAMVAVAQWKYRPATKDGKPCAIRANFPVEFGLSARDLAELEERRTKELLPAGPPALPVDTLDEWPILRKEIRPKLPEVLRQRLQMGEAIIQLIVDEGGVPRDVHTLMTTHAECASAAEDVVRRWHFTPGRKDGQAVRCRLEVSLVFFPENPGASGLRVRPGVRSGLDGTERLPPELREAQDFTKVPGMVFPKIRKQKKPEYPEEMGSRGQRGHAIAEYIIDARGRVSHVRMIDKTNDYFGVVIERAVSEWKFDPATLNGRPVACRALQEFDFELR